jgi:hypothetical protein
LRDFLARFFPCPAAIAEKNSCRSARDTDLGRVPTACGYNGATEKHMKNAKITRSQHKALQLLSRKDLRLIRKHPKLVSNAKQLLVVCRKVLKKIESIPKYAGRKKRETAYKRIAALCRKAIEKIDH